MEGFSSNIAVYEDGITIIYLTNVAPVSSIKLTINLHFLANNIKPEDNIRDIQQPELTDGYGDFIEDGGITAFRSYYEEISKRAKYNVLPTEWAYQELIKLHLDAGKIQQAQGILNELLDNYSFPHKGHLNRIGYDFSTAEIHAIAIKVFALNVKNHPYSASAYDSLGDGYYRFGKFNEALNCYRKSAELANNSGSRHLAYYQKQIEKAQKKINN